MMKSIHCINCGAGLTADLSKQFITCPHCDTRFENSCFEAPRDEEEGGLLAGLTAMAAAAAGDDPVDELTDEEDIYLDDTCIEYLVDLGSAARVDEMDYVTFGTPIRSGKKLARARENFAIPEEDDVYFIYDSTIFGGCQRGFALCTTGIYYVDDNGSADDHDYFSWEEFIDEQVVHEDEKLHISTASFITGGNEEVADFLIDFHDQVHEYWYEA